MSTVLCIGVPKATLTTVGQAFGEKATLFDVSNLPLGVALAEGLTDSASYVLSIDGRGSAFGDYPEHVVDGIRCLLERPEIDQLYIMLHYHNVDPEEEQITITKSIAIRDDDPIFDEIVRVEHLRPPSEDYALEVETRYIVSRH